MQSRGFLLVFSCLFISILSSIWLLQVRPSIVTRPTNLETPAPRAVPPTTPLTARPTAPPTTPPTPLKIVPRVDGAEPTASPNSVQPPTPALVPSRSNHEQKKGADTDVPNPPTRTYVRQAGSVRESDICPKKWPPGEPKRRRIVRKRIPDLPYCNSSRTFAYLLTQETDIAQWQFNNLANTPPEAKSPPEVKRVGREIILLTNVSPAPNSTLDAKTKLTYAFDAESRIHKYFVPKADFRSARKFLVERAFDLEKKNGCLFGYIVVLDGNIEFSVSEYEHRLMMYEPAVGFSTQHPRVPFGVPQCRHYTSSALVGYHRTAFNWLMSYDGSSALESHAQLMCLWRYYFPLHTYVFPLKLPRAEHDRIQSEADLGNEYQARCVDIIAQNFPELIGTQPSSVYSGKSPIDTVVGSSSCFADPVQGPGDAAAGLEFLGERDYTALLEAYANSVLASLPANVRDRFLSSTPTNYATAEFYMGRFGNEQPRNPEAHTQMVQRCWNNELIH